MTGGSPIALQAPDHAARSLRRRAGGLGDSSSRPASRRRCRRDRPRHDAGHQRDDRAQGRAARAARHQAASATCLEMGTEQRYDIYDLFLSIPEPLVPRRAALRGRASASTATAASLQPLDPRRDPRGRRASCVAERRARRSRSASCTPIAIPRTSSARGDLIRATLPDLSVSLSSEVCAGDAGIRALQHDRGERLRPAADGRATSSSLERELAARGFRGALHLMHLGGGIARRETARAFPIRLLESGPAGRRDWPAPCSASSPARRDVISFDMGGTTAKACLIEDGRAEIAPMTARSARVHRFKRGSRPADQGAGDRHDRDRRRRRLDRRRSTRSACSRSGRARAGADPGPACYGRGGTRADRHRRQSRARLSTIRLLPRRRMALDLQAARTAVGDASATPLGLSVDRRRLGHPQGRHREHGARPRASTRREGQGPARATPWSPSAAPGRRMPPASRACSGVARGHHPAGLGRGLGARLPRRAARPSSMVRSMPVRLEGRDAAAVNGSLAELEAEGRGLLRGAGVPPPRSRSSAPPTCASSGRCTRSPCRCRPARSTGEGSPRDPRRLREAYTRALHLASMRAPAARRSTSASACPARCRTLSLPSAAGGGDAAAKRQGHRARPGSRAASARRRSTTAMRSRRATASRARPSSRSARRPRSCRRAIASRSTMR